MAMGVIPVYSDVVDAFKANLHFDGYAVAIAPELTVQQVAEQIINFEKKIPGITGEVLYGRYKELFDQFYNDSLYITRLSERIRTYS
jgi:hypothetical protein